MPTIDDAATEAIHYLNETFKYNVEMKNENQYLVHFVDHAGPASFTVELLYENGGIVCSVLNEFEMTNQRLSRLMNRFVKLLDC
jgi:hypothetical protein